MYRGYIKLFRRIEDNKLWKKKRRISHAEAWIDLLLMANHKKSKIFIGYQEIEVKRGEVFTSQKQLAKRWKWGIASVHRFLMNLQTLRKAEIKAETKYTIIFIVNYTKYQRRPRKMETKTKNKRKSNGNQTETYNNNRSTIQE